MQRNLNRSTFVVWETWHHNMCWKWPPFASRQDWTRRATFWKVFANTSAVTAWISLVMFNTFVINWTMRNSQLDISSWFTATSHTSHTSIAEILSFFCDRFISKGLWPLLSPDLKPPDYFLWGYLKGTVYQNKPRTIDALKANITEEIQAVTADVLARTFQNMTPRFQSCLDANGGHFQHMLWCRHISHTTNVLLFKFRCNIFIGVRIIKEMPGLVTSRTPCIIIVNTPYYSI